MCEEIFGPLKNKLILAFNIFNKMQKLFKAKNIFYFKINFDHKMILLFEPMQISQIMQRINSNTRLKI